MSKLEKMFWAGLMLTAGMIIGAVMVSLSQVPKKKDCNDGMSEYIKDGVKIKTYLPALDDCKGDK